MFSTLKNIIRPPRKIGQILRKNGLLTEVQLNAALNDRNKNIGQVLIEKGFVNKEQIDAALAIQRKERASFFKIIAVLACILILLSIPAISSLKKSSGIVIREAKTVTGVDKEMRPLKVTNYFPKDTMKVCAWIRWSNAKINSQILVKWYYVTDDVPIYDYTLNIPKKDGIANVILAMPQGKTLPAGTYKVMLLSGKKPLIKPLIFEIE